MGPNVYHTITASKFMLPVPILTLPSTRPALNSSPFRPAHFLKEELPAEAWHLVPATYINSESNLKPFSLCAELHL